MLLKYDIEVHDRASEKSHEKSDSFLHQSMKNLIDRERFRENRNRIAEKNKSGGPKDTTAAPAKGDGRKGRKGSPAEDGLRSVERRARSATSSKRVNVIRGRNCPFKHVKDGKARTKSPRRKNTRSPSRGNKGDKGKKLSKEEMTKTPCIYYAQGSCSRGDKCYYKHEDKAAAATKDSPKRTNSPAPKKDKKGKDSNAAPCLIDRCQKFACIAKTKPKATSSQVDSEPVSMKRIRFRKSVRLEYASGQTTCTTCGYEPLPVDESGQVKFQPNRRSRMLERRMRKFSEFGIYGDVNSSLLQAIAEEQGEQLRQAIVVRGLTSIIEAATIRESRDRYKRALKCGYMNVEDRYGSDVQFCDRVHQDGRIASWTTCSHSPICLILQELGHSYQLASPPMPNMSTS